ncbi:type I toxin-antitoxin system Fst family toxin [Latilactobacillus sakei]
MKRCFSQSSNGLGVFSVLNNFLVPLLVACLTALFDHWLDNRNKK